MIFFPKNVFSVQFLRFFAEKNQKSSKVWKSGQFDEDRVFLKRKRFPCFKKHSRQSRRAINEPVVAGRLFCPHITVRGKKNPYMCVAASFSQLCQFKNFEKCLRKSQGKIFSPRPQSKINL